jgi:AraC-like DNA-binding protein
MSSVVKIGDIATPFVTLLLRSAERYGADPQRLLAKAGIDPLRLGEIDARISIQQYMRLGFNAIEATGEPALGLRMGEGCRISDLGWPGLLAMAAPTLGEALASQTRFEGLVSRNYRGHSWFDHNPETPGPVFYSIAPYNSYTTFVVDAVLCWWEKLIHRLAGQEGLVREVHVEFPAPSYANRYQDAFGVPVLFEQASNRLVLMPHAPALPNRFGEPQLYAQLLASAEEKLRKLAVAETFRGRVQQILGPLLHGNTPTIEDTAARLGIPDWTLRRKLKDEGTNFQTLLDEMRKDLALGYMRDTALSFGEIAYILGFSTPGAFQRAFKRWTGVTPGSYRKSREKSPA